MLVLHTNSATQIKFTFSCIHIPELLTVAFCDGKDKLFDANFKTQIYNFTNIEIYNFTIIEIYFCEGNTNGFVHISPAGNGKYILGKYGFLSRQSLSSYDNQLFQRK